MTEESELKKHFEMVQSMIDISAGHLEGLRTQCATSVEITQQEIRTIEGKLIKQFSRQLVAKAKLPSVLKDELKMYPRLKQWLQVVGLGKNAIGSLASRIYSMESLLETTEKDIKSLLQKCGCRDEETRRLISAMRILKNYTDRQLLDDKAASTSDIDLHWDSWDRSPKTLPRTRQTRTSVPTEDNLRSPPPANNSPYSSAPQTPQTPIEFSPISIGNQINKERRYTPPPTPPITGKKKEKLKFPTTPPPHKKNQTRLNPPEQFPLTKSKSHESQLANRVEQLDPFSGARLPNQHLIGRSIENLPTRKRLATEPALETESIFISHSPSGHSSPVFSSPVRSPPYSAGDNIMEDLSYKPNTLIVPKSPKTPTHGFMGHFIQHRFTKTIKVTTCQYCDKQMIIGYKCKECKYKCHRDCATKCPPSCGLPNEFLDMFAQSLRNEGSISHSPVLRPYNSPVIIRNDDVRKVHPNICIPAFHGPDSSSNTSSCNSSAPSSPALIITSHTLPSPSYNSHPQEFRFPDVITTDNDGITIETRPIIDEKSEMIATHQSNDSDKTVSGSGTSGSTDSERTLPGRIDSQDSQVSDADPQERTWPRQNSLSLREWDIPYDELSIYETIGTGRFGTVFRGNWHGDVAIKVLNMDHIDDEKQLEAFKQEVATFRKTRHENLVLFMGACMKPPHLAIITSLCKGNTLYTHIHHHKNKFNMNRVIMIAMQISQGMGYLQARGIVHKDLKSKNIFLENGKVVITDFGLFSVTKLCYGNRKGDWLSIPPGWLCYLAPEIVRSLQAGSHAHADELPFTVATDVYAFGTVWYELLCGEWPFKDQPAEAIIWQVGRGIKQSLAQIQASRDVKDILMLCWAYKSEERAEFSQLLKSLERLPKKRLARSPSHPIHLSRSAESVF